MMDRTCTFFRLNNGGIELTDGLPIADVLNILEKLIIYKAWIENNP